MTRDKCQAASGWAPTAHAWRDRDGGRGDTSTVGAAGEHLQIIKMDTKATMRPWKKGDGICTNYSSLILREWK